LNTIRLRDDRLPTNRPLASALANRAVASGRPARYPIYSNKPRVPYASSPPTNSRNDRPGTL
jgi:hypothetical protein